MRFVIPFHYRIRIPFQSRIRSLPFQSNLPYKGASPPPRSLHISSPRTVLSKKSRMETLTFKQRFMKPWEEGSGAEYQFRQYYSCQPLFDSQKSKLDGTNKVIMPMSALERLTSLNVPYPIMFSVHNPIDDSFFSGYDGGSGRICHCGVLDFTAEEGFVHMPRWMMDKLELDRGDLVYFQNTALPQGTYIKLQPHTTEFINLDDPKAVLENTLKEYSCLTSGDTITIPHNGKQFYINILETKPGSAIHIVDTDCKVDFVAPLDYKEPEKKPASRAVNKKVEEAEKKKDEDPMFVPFRGLGRRLDGTPVAVYKGERESKEVSRSSCVETSCKSGGGSCKKSGKLVFGPEANGGGSIPQKESNAKGADVPKKEDAPKFQAFTGRKHSLI